MKVAERLKTHNQFSSHACIHFSLEFWLMAEPKLYQNLRQLPPELLDRFSSFLNSSLYKVRQDSRALWAALLPYYPQFDVADHHLFETALPRTEYNEGRVRILRSYLSSHLEQFLAIIELEKDQTLRSRLLRRSAERFKLPQLSKKIWQSNRTFEPWHPELDLEEFILLNEKLRLSVRHQNRSAKHDLQAVILPLDHFYITTRLKYLCGMVDPSIQTDEGPPSPALEEIKALYYALEDNVKGLSAMYFHLLHVLLGDQYNLHYFKLKALLSAHHADLEPNEAINLYTLSLIHI